MRVRFTGVDRVARWRAVQQLSHQLRDLDLPSLHGVAATYDSALVEFDPLRLSAPDMATLLRREARTAAADRTSASQEGRHFRLPACYEPDYGPDLAQVAAAFDVDAREVRERHLSRPHLVWSYGAPAAAPLMDGLGWEVSIPRRSSPRTRVPPGSLALAGEQSIIYTVPAPGGWQIIGRTPARLVRARDEVCAYRAGDLISYFPITSGEWDRYADSDLEDFRV